VIEPSVSLAFAAYSNPGAYALLLGSGVSRAAGIPTGWEVVLDLVEKVAELLGEETSGDPVKWYTDRYQIEPEYSSLLAELAARPAERQRLLRSYFEPTEEEQDQGLKVPTVAHHAVARLVRDGYVRVVVTTNFDRLLETALNEQGVAPTVIASADASRGALPLAHTSCTIVKVHGDYLDARLRNTPSELAEYEPEIDALLDRIFDEYGLIVCGWSGEWDQALRDAVSRCSSHRFTTYWASRGTPSEAISQLLELRKAVVVPIADADTFFSDLADKVTSLQQLGARHPLSARVAVETLKRFLPEAHHRIRLRDLVLEEVRRVEASTADSSFPTGDPAPDYDCLLERMARYEVACETLVALLVNGSYWGGAGQHRVWVDVLERLGTRGDTSGGYVVWSRLRQYPTLLALYAGGLGAIAGRDLETLAVLFGEPKQLERGTETPLILALNPSEILDSKMLQPPGGSQYHTPSSNHLETVLREPLREFLPNDESYADVFDQFEYLFGIAFWDLYARQLGREWAPVGIFGWRQRRLDKDASALGRIVADAEIDGDAWPFLRLPLFNGSYAQFTEVQAAYEKHVKSLPWF
jgi:hypothetical protein